MPDCEEDYHIQHAMRMFPVWKEEIKELENVSYEGLIKLYVDKVETVEGKPRCIDKDIKEMEWDELQSLACYLKLREIPLYKSGSIRAAREKAYEKYQEKVLEKRVFKTPQEIRHFKETMRRNLEALMISESEIEKRINEEIDKAFNMIENPDDPKNSYSFAKVDAIVVKDYNTPKPKKTAKV